MRDSCQQSLLDWSETKNEGRLGKKKRGKALGTRLLPRLKHGLKGVAPPGKKMQSPGLLVVTEICNVSNFYFTMFLFERKLDQLQWYCHANKVFIFTVVHCFPPNEWSTWDLPAIALPKTPCIFMYTLNRWEKMQTNKWRKS